MRVLITCGPTWVPIDQVRVISNTSSGEMGHLIAEEFLKAKAEVTLIEGPVTHIWDSSKAKVIKYKFFDDLEKTLKIELKKKYQIVVHAAAVSDFKVEKIVKGKIASGQKKMLLLTPTIKLIDLIKRMAPQSFLVGFKLEPKFQSKTIYRDVKSLLTQSGCDLVVANSLTGGYQGFIVDADGQIRSTTSNKKILAQHLVKLLV